LIGLFSNVGLTALKGVAGYVLASSALLADAAHSGSDLIADVVTLASYRVGRWKPSEKYPYGYGSKSFSFPPFPFPNQLCVR
jgi:divalent metal cation (Fe/Co/Zn/Cd) transporter